MVIFNKVLCVCVCVCLLGEIEKVLVANIYMYSMYAAK